MTKEEFFKQNDAEFLGAGFSKDETDPMFLYTYDLVDDDTKIEIILDEDEEPKLLFGDTGINSGFCIYTGEHFVWFQADSPSDAIEFAKRITAFEQV